MRTRVAKYRKEMTERGVKLHHYLDIAVFLQMVRFRRLRQSGRRMIGVIAINVVMFLLALGIVSRVLPAKMFSGMIDVLHKTIGITLPTPDQERTVAVIWIASMIVIGDGILFLLVFLTSTVKG